MRRFGQGLLILLCLPTLSLAAAKDFYAMESQCRQEMGGVINNAVVTGCAAYVSQQAHKDMQQYMNKILQIMKQNQWDDDYKKFLAAQTGWQQYRDNWCDNQGSLISSPMYNTCRMDQDIARVEELEQFLEQLLPNQ